MTDGPQDGSSTRSHSQAGSHAAHIVHSVEGAVEHAVESTERSLARQLGERGMRIVVWKLRALGWLALAAYFIFCGSLISLRVWFMPHIDDWRGQIEARASAILKQQVTIGHIESGWQGFNPRLQLTDVRLHDASGAVSLTLSQIDAVISWTSVPTLKAQVKSLVVLAPELEVRRVSESLVKIAGITIDLQATQSNASALNWVLTQRRVAVSHAIVHYYDDAAQAARGGGPSTPVDMTDVSILLSHHLGTHHFALHARPPSDIADLIDVRGWFEKPWSTPVSNPAGWSGRLFAQLNFVDLAKLESLARLMPQPFHLRQGNGAMRAWIDFNALTIQRARADLAFTDVELRLRSDGPPLRLTSLQGRITQQAWRTGSILGQDIAFTHLAVQGPDGLHLPPTDLTYRASRPLEPADAPMHTEVSVDALSLEDLDRLASQLPLPTQAQDAITRYALRGSVTDLSAAWDSDADHLSNVALRARFDRLAVAAQPADPPLDASGRPRPGQPGFQNLSGSIDLSPRGGTVALASAEARLFLPGLFEDAEVPANRLNARVHWTTGPVLEVGVDAFAFSNDDLEFGMTGTYQVPDSGPASIDVSASLVRANVAAVPRYMPLSAGAGTRSWLSDALRDGRVLGGSLRLRGRLSDFPFVARDSGEFQASLHVSGATLDYAPAGGLHPRVRPWPAISGIEADLRFDRDQLEIRSDQASAYGVRLSRVSGRIAPWSGRDPHLTISGQGNGELSDLVGFVNASPIAQLIGGFLDTTKTSGPGRLQLRLDIPLNRSADTEVAGSVFFLGNDIVLRNDLPPLSAASGRLDFTQHGIHMAGVGAGLAGGQARIDVDTAAEGAVAIRIAGTATPQGLRRQLESSVVRKILDNSRGATHYALSANVHGHAVELHASSDLVGVSIDLPDPIGKTAAAALALRVDLVPTLGVSPARDTVSVTADNLLNVQLERVAVAQDGPMSIDRGLIGIGSPSLGAPATLPEAGLLLHLVLHRLDADRWLHLIESASDEAVGGGVTSSAKLPDLVAANIDELWVSGKALHNVVVGASRAGDGGWNANVEADQTSGSLHWVSATASTPAKLTARLARLLIPEGAREPVTEVLDAPVRDLPELDVVADDFVLGSSHLGRLELDAQSSGTGRANTWQLKRLLIDDPDGRISGTGQWQREPGSRQRRMTLSITLDIADAGNLLGRFGVPGAIKNGKGKLAANLSWLGSPFSIDYATLSGDVQLSADKGQFLKVDPGAGRLLGVMSLQSLPRRALLDFRDVFSQGFAFDTIRATAHLSKGLLSTSDFKMIGASASVLIEGEADLKNETQNLHVLVLPEINAGSASVVYAFLANPFIGVGTFLAQWALRHPLSKIFSYEYDVTGSWAAPQVRRHERAKPETSEEKTG